MVSFNKGYNECRAVAADELALCHSQTSSESKKFNSCSRELSTCSDDLEESKFFDKRRARRSQVVNSDDPEDIRYMDYLPTSPPTGVVTADQVMTEFRLIINRLDLISGDWSSDNQLETDLVKFVELVF